MVVKAAPMTIPTARSTTLPRMMKALNSRSQAGSRSVIGGCMVGMPFTATRAADELPCVGYRTPARKENVG